MGSTQVLCFLTLFAEDVDPDKVLRRYQWSRSGGQGLCDRCQGAFSRCNCFLPHFKVSMTPGAYRWSERRCNTCCTTERSSCEHRARTTCFRVLILCCIATLHCDTNGPAHAPTVLSLAQSAASSAASVCASCFAWAIAVCALNHPASQSGAFTVCALLQQLRCCLFHSSCLTPPSQSSPMDQA